MTQRVGPGDPVAVTCPEFSGWGPLEAEWRELEAEAEAPAFFQGWTWMGCLARERFSHPVVVRARRAGRTVGLALFNRRRGVLHLSESGDPAWDSVYVEHNAPLVAPGMPPDTVQRMLRAAWQSGALGMRLAGVPENVAEIAGGTSWRQRLDHAPWRDLAVVRAAGGDPLAGLSANTRQQVRRAMRRAETQGPLRLERAADVPTAQEWLASLVGLHSARWMQRGKPGAFATAQVRRFHAELLARGVPRGEIDLLRLVAGPTVLGYLYNFRLGGRVLAYQSGLVEAASPQDKPGLVAHVLAMRQAVAQGMQAYDFLAGDVRYKRSLADRATPLMWADLLPPLRPKVLLGGMRLYRRR